MKKSQNQQVASILKARVSNAAVGVRELARRSSLSPTSVSQALISGNLSAKNCVLLSWALNRDPLSLTTEIIELILAGNGVSGSHAILTEEQFFRAVADRHVWLYMPDGDIHFPGICELISRIPDPRLFRLFVTVTAYRRIREVQDIGAVNLHTPSVNLMTFPLAYAVTDPPRCSKVFSIIHVGGRRVFVEVPNLTTYLPHVELLERETLNLNLLQIADFERKKGSDWKDRLTVWVYTKDFPELEDSAEGRATFDAVTGNVMNGVKYLYFTPSFGGSDLTSQVAQMNFEALKTRIASIVKDRGKSWSDDALQQIPVDQKLLMYPTGIFYNAEGGTLDYLVRKQGEPDPIRFEHIKDQYQKATIKVGFLQLLETYRK